MRVEDFQLGYRNVLQFFYFTIYQMDNPYAHVERKHFRISHFWGFKGYDGISGLSYIS